MPSLRERVGSWIAGARATDAVPMHPMHSVWFGPGIGNQPSHEALLRESIGIADTATRAIANRVSTLNPQVKVSRRAQDGTLEDEILDDHPLQALIHRPHPNLSLSQLLRLTGQYIVTVGEAYWLKVGNGAGIPVELHPMLPGNVKPRMDNNVVAEYLVTDGDGRQKPVAANDVVRFFFPDPENIWASEGYLGPSAITVDTNKFASQHLRQHYENDATPKTALETGEGATAFKTDEQRRFTQMWMESYHSRMGKDQGAPAILPLGYKLIQMATQTGADLTPLLEFWSDELLMSFGTPKSILGKVVSGDRSSAETNQYVFDRHTIKPIATLIADGLTLQLAPDFDASLFVAFEEFVSDDKQFTLEQETADLVGKVRSINQVRIDRGLDEVEWGDDPVGKLGEVPYEPDAFTLEEDDAGALGGEAAPVTSASDPDRQTGKFDEGEAITSANVLNGAQVASIVTIVENVAAGLLQKSSGVELMGVAFGIDHETASKIIGDLREPAPESAEDRIRSLVRVVPIDRAARAAFFTLEAEWLRQVDRERMFVPAFRRAMLKVLTTQKRTVLARLRKQMPRARIAAEDIFATQEWGDLFAREVDPVRERAFQNIMQQTLDGFGIVDFDFTATQQKVLRKQAAQLVKHTGKTTQGLIRRQLELGMGKGESVDQIAKRIRSVFDTRRHQSRTIARTEILKASQAAQLESFSIAGVEVNQWNTARDAAVRDSHVPVEGQQRPKGTPFNLGDGEQADAPGVGAGGSVLSAGNAINCRCFLSPVV